MVWAIGESATVAKYAAAFANSNGLPIATFRNDPRDQNAGAVEFCERRRRRYRGHSRSRVWEVRRLARLCCLLTSYSKCSEAWASRKAWCSMACP